MTSSNGQVQFFKILRLSVAVFVCAVALVGCGSDDSESSTSTGVAGGNPPTSPEEEAVVLNLNVNPIKQFAFSWDATDGESVSLLEDADGDGNFLEIFFTLDSVEDASFITEVPLYFRSNTRYSIKKCSGERCVGSDPIAVPEGLVDGIGYLKSPFIEEDNAFGSSIAISSDGSTMAVGALRPAATYGPRDSVFVFEREQGRWVFKAQLFARYAFDKFGSAVSLSGDGSVLVAGAYLEGDNESGAAYVFHRNEDGDWVEQAYLRTEEESGDQAYFGYAVSVTGDGRLVAVGAPKDNFATGAVHIYAKTEDRWRLVQSERTVAYDIGAPNPEFGKSIAFSADGNTLAVGAPGEDGNGAVHVFNKGNAGDPASWQHVDRFESQYPGYLDWFGHTLALNADGTVMVVGAPFEQGSGAGIGQDETDDSSYKVGAVFVFRHTSGDWAQEAYIKASNSAYYMLFGSEVAISGDGNTIVVGADNEHSGGVGVNPEPVVEGRTKSGAAYVFHYGKRGWQQKAHLKASNPGIWDQFGSAVAVTGDGLTVAVGAPGEDSGYETAAGALKGLPNNSVENAGAVYLY